MILTPILWDKEIASNNENAIRDQLRLVIDRLAQGAGLPLGLRDIQLICCDDDICDYLVCLYCCPTFKISFICSTKELIFYKNDKVVETIEEASGLHTRCKRCGEVHANIDLTMCEGAQYCSKCVTAAGFTICAHCLRGHTFENIFVAPNGLLLCKRCMDITFPTCSDCHHRFPREDITYIDNCGYICHACRNSDEYYECYECDEWAHIDDMVVDGRGNRYCQPCWEGRDEDDNDPIHDYSFRPIPNFKMENGNANDELYLGVELEVDKGKDAQVCAGEIEDITSDVYMKWDGSLEDDGFEIVSHPATLGYHKNELKWKEIVKKCREYGYLSHDTSTCGLHVHASRKFFGVTEEAQDLGIAKVVMLVNRFWDNYILPLSRRKKSGLRWCAKGTALEVSVTDAPSVVSHKLKEKKYVEGRYVAVNLQNLNTIEFRMFRGTLKVSTIIANLEFVDAICRFAKRISIEEVNTCKWRDIIEGDYPKLHELCEIKELN